MSLKAVHFYDVNITDTHYSDNQHFLNWRMLNIMPKIMILLHNKYFMFLKAVNFYNVKKTDTF